MSKAPGPATVTIVGIDVGGTHTKWSVLTSSGERRRGETRTCQDGTEALVRQLADLVSDVRPDAGAVGVAMPATVDATDRRTLVVPNIPGQWDNYPIGSALESHVGTQVSLINDARAFALAELHAGAAQGRRDVLFAALGTGVGGALAQQGRIVVGDTDWVGELGHVLVDADGQLCGCGARGCLETIASAPAVVAHCVRPFLTGRASALINECDGDLTRLTAAAVARAAAVGDPWAAAALEHAGRALGTAFASLSSFLHPEAIVIGGGLAGAFRYLEPPIQVALAPRIPLTGKVELLQAQLGSYAGAIGAGLNAALRAGHEASIFTTNL